MHMERERERERASERRREGGREREVILAQGAYNDFVTFGVLASSRGRVWGEGSCCAHETGPPPLSEK